MIDVFAIPDYKALLEPHLSNWSRYAKEDDTILVWRFRAVQRSQAFPMGSKVEYRKFSQDVVPIIIPSSDPRNPVGCQVEWRFCNWEPEACEENNNIAGIYMMKNDLRGEIKAASFVKNSHQDLTATVSKIGSDYSSNRSIVQQWELFRRDAPSSDDASEYVENLGGLHVPLYDRLFFGLTSPTLLRPNLSDLPISNNQASVAENFAGPDSDGYHCFAMSLAHVQWDGRPGAKKQRHLPPTVKVNYRNENIATAMKRNSLILGQDYASLRINDLKLIMQHRSIPIGRLTLHADLVEALKQWDASQSQPAARPTPHQVMDTKGIVATVFKYFSMGNAQLKEEIREKKLSCPLGNKLQMVTTLLDHQQKQLLGGASDAPDSTSSTI